MSVGQFTDFLGTGFSLVDEFCEDGAIVMSFMDWRHQAEILAAAVPIFGPLKQLCVWAKDNGGMGTKEAALEMRDEPLTASAFGGPAAMPTPENIKAPENAATKSNRDIRELSGQPANGS
jgi:hypothetical protein